MEGERERWEENLGLRVRLFHGQFNRRHLLRCLLPLALSALPVQPFFLHISALPHHLSGLGHLPHRAGPSRDGIGAADVCV